MTTERRGVAFTPMELRRDIILKAAMLADELGYEFFSLAEGWGFDSTLLLTEIALRTRRVHLVSGVLSVWGRSPATLAMMAATLHHISGGRFVLGLGASTKALVEGLHGSPFTHPADKLRDVTTRVRALLDGDLPPARTDTATRQLRLGIAPTPDVPIWLGAISSRTVQVAADVADGWFPFFMARTGIAGWTASFDARSGGARVRPAPLTIAAGPTVVVDQDAQVAERIASASVAWYLSAMGDVYSRVVSDQGYAAEVRAIRAANPKPRLHDGVVPPEAHGVLEQFTVSGTPTHVRERLEDWSGIADVVMLVCPAGLPWASLEATLRAAAPSHSWVAKNERHTPSVSVPIGSHAA